MTKGEVIAVILSVAGSGILIRMTLLDILAELREIRKEMGDRA